MLPLNSGRDFEHGPFPGDSCAGISPHKLPISRPTIDAGNRARKLGAASQFGACTRDFGFCDSRWSRTPSIRRHQGDFSSRPPTLGEKREGLNPALPAVASAALTRKVSFKPLGLQSKRLPILITCFLRIFRRVTARERSSVGGPLFSIIFEGFGCLDQMLWAWPADCLFGRRVWRMGSNGSVT